MKAKCAGCGKRTPIDVDLLDDGQEARHFECAEDPKLDMKRVRELLRRAGIRTPPKEERDATGPQDDPHGDEAPRRKGKPKITKATAGVRVDAA